MPQCTYSPPGLRKPAKYSSLRRYPEMAFSVVRERSSRADFRVISLRFRELQRACDFCARPSTPPHYHDATPTSIRSYIVKKTLILLAAVMMLLMSGAPPSAHAVGNPTCPLTTTCQ